MISMPSLQGFKPIWGFPMTIYKTVEKNVSKTVKTNRSKTKGHLEEKTIIFKKNLRLLQEQA